MAALFAFKGSQIVSNLLSVLSMRAEVCRYGPCWSLTIEYVLRRAWYIGCALGLQPREEISIISVRSKVSAHVAYWLGGIAVIKAAPVRRTEFDSLHPLHVSSAGVAQVEERRSRKAEVGVSNIPSGSSFDIWGSRSTAGPLACNQQMGVRFPPLPPNSLRDAVAELRRL